MSISSSISGVKYALSRDQCMSLSIKNYNGITKNMNFYESFHKKTKAQYHIISERNYTYHIILNILKDYVHGKKDILDIGCGAGTISLYLAKKGKHNILGIDVSEIAIESSKKSAAILSIKNAWFETMNFPIDTPKGKYDIILCFEVIEHLKKDQLAINRIFNMLKAGGIIILSTPSLNAPLFRMGYAKRFDEKVGHLRRYNVEQLSSMFKTEGFKILEIKKTEGILRNFLFLSSYAGWLIRFIKFPFSLVVEKIDDIFLALFGESDIFIIAQKP